MYMADPHSRASVNVSLDAGLLPRLAARVGATPSLAAHRLVDLSSSHLTPHHAHIVQKALTSATQDAAAELQLCRFRPQPSVLISLILRDNPLLGDQGLSAVVDTLLERAPLRLHLLSLTAVGASERGVKRLAEGLNDPTRPITLASLDLSHNAIDIDACSSIASILSLPLSQLTDLNISTNPIGDAGARVLAEGLMRSSSLTKLNLAHARIAAPGLRAIAGGLAAQNSLTQLSLQGNLLYGEEGALAVHVLLASAPQLCQLTLSQMRMGPPLGKALASAWCEREGEGDARCGVGSSPPPIHGHEASWTLPSDALACEDSHLSLIHLGLERVGLCDGGPLARVLTSPHCKLDKLWLGGNHLQDDSAHALARALSCAACVLRLLHLGDNRIRSAGASALVEAALEGFKHNRSSNCSHLADLMIGGNLLSPEEYVALEERVLTSQSSLRLHIPQLVSRAPLASSSSPPRLSASHPQPQLLSSVVMHQACGFANAPTVAAERMDSLAASADNETISTVQDPACDVALRQAGQHHLAPMPPIERDEA
ncbi:MAG: hypothetical protein SGPRY_005517 [Prymnesium sp.]